MKAAVLYQPGDLRIEDRPVPECAPDDVLVQVSFNGLCGTDATEYSKGPMMVPLSVRHPGSGHQGPTILGHEFIGTVVDAGSNAKGRVGTRVACGAGVSCGSCAMCQAGRTNLCDSYYTLGLSTHGGLAEFAVAPSSTCVDIPEECSDVNAALAQPLAVGIHAVDRAALADQDTVVVLGVGAIGTFILAALKGFQGRVVAVDVDPERLAVAQAMGVDEVLTVAPDVTAEELKESIGAPVDVVIESSGVNGAAERSFDLVKMGGNVVLVGLNKVPQALNLASIVLREINVQTTVAHVCGTDLPKALSILKSHDLASNLPARVIPLAGVVSDGFEPLVAGRAGGKILVNVGAAGG